GVPGAGPEEPAQPVAPGARDDVRVQVGHALADDVVHRHEGPLRAEGVRQRGGHPAHRGEEGAEQLVRQVGQGDDVDARHHEHMSLEHRPRVEEGDDVLRGEDDVGGRRARDDPAEDTSFVPRHARLYRLTTLLPNRPMPSTSTSTRWPGSTGPTPAGVPVRMMSPGSRVKMLET